MVQSLTLANDQAFFECAAALAQRALEEAPASNEERAALAFRLCLARGPSADERHLLASLVKQEIAGSPSDDLAGWTRVCRVLLNLDETITRE